MLIYMSSYPRSGSSLMQQIINNFFEKPWTGVDTANKPLHEITGIPSYFKNWHYDPKILSNKKTIYHWLLNYLNRRFLKIYNLNKWIATYDLNVPPYTKNCRYLLPGCRDVLTLKNRQKLADEETYFFVKTHNLPYKKYLNNEYVIQMTRHPGAVCLSFLKFLNNINQQKTLDEVIKGKTFYGSWSKWHQRWNQVIPSLNGRFLQLKYEDTLLNPGKVCEQIQALIHLEYKNDKNIPSFKELNQANPNYYVSGNTGHWKHSYSHNQMTLLYQLHGVTIQQLDYDKPECF